MADAPFYHVGILVADFDAAVEKFSSIFGITFAPPMDAPVTMQGVDGPFDVHVKATYSLEGPPFIEIMEGTPGDGIFGLDQGEGVHHLGVWTPSWDEYGNREPHRCLPVCQRVHMIPGADPTMWLTDPADLFGVRVEFVDQAMKPMLGEWIGRPVD